MKVFTPGDVARTTNSKYLGVLVAAKYARALNEFRRNDVVDDAPGTEKVEKLTTTALGSVTTGDVEFNLTPRRRPNDL